MLPWGLAGSLLGGEVAEGLPEGGQGSFKTPLHCPCRSEARSPTLALITDCGRTHADS